MAPDYSVIRAQLEKRTAIKKTSFRFLVVFGVGFLFILTPFSPEDFRVGLSGVFCVIVSLLSYLDSVNASRMLMILRHFEATDQPNHDT